MEKARQAEFEFRTGQLIDEPALGGGLHPGPGERHGHAEKEQPIVAVLEGSESPAQAEMARHETPRLRLYVRGRGDDEGPFIRVVF